jgi:hypothetical protein
MQEYLNYIKSQSPFGITSVGTFDRETAHTYFENIKTLQVLRNIYVYDNVNLTQISLSTTFPKEQPISAVLTPAKENIKYSYPILESLIEQRDAIMILGMAWLSVQALIKEGFTLYKNNELVIKTLTLFQLHKAMAEENNNFYSLHEVTQRIPLALTRIDLEKKVFLSLTNNITIKNIIHAETLPQEWFQKLN